MASKLPLIKFFNSVIFRSSCCNGTKDYEPRNIDDDNGTHNARGKTTHRKGAREAARAKN